VNERTGLRREGVAESFHAKISELLSNVVDETFFRLVSETASRAISVFSSAQPPKPDSSLPARRWVGLSYIWLRLGGDDIETASPKAIPHF
jgi:hypothetical protein